jgi:hypothetical protein
MMNYDNYGDFEYPGYRLVASKEKRVGQFILEENIK